MESVHPDWCTRKEKVGVTKLAGFSGIKKSRSKIYAKQTRNSSTTGRHGSVSKHSIRCPGVKAKVAPSLGAPVSSRTIQRRLAEGHLGSQRPLRVLPLTPTQWSVAKSPRVAEQCDVNIQSIIDAHPSAPLFGVVPRTRKLYCSGMEPGRLER
ncbi:hypothetical protein TNCV_3498871 [Trichonephila clavipes]|nr:hypothetical protein TNCV_3498871 [Trichonephila clavipes]